MDTENDGIACEFAYPPLPGADIQFKHASPQVLTQSSAETNNLTKNVSL